MKVKRFLKKVKAVSPILAVLMMIIVAVAASLIAYAWVMGYVGFTTTKAGKSIQIQSFALVGGNLMVYIQNIGDGTVKLNESQCLYVDGKMLPGDLDDDELGKGETATFTADGTGFAGKTIKVKVVTTDGTFMEATGIPLASMLLAHSSLTCTASPSIIIIGESVTVSGSLNYTILGATISLNYTRPDGSSFIRTTPTDASGSYTDTFNPDVVGAWAVFAHWDGDSTHEAATSSTDTFSVNLLGTSLTCLVTPTTITLGETATVSGKLNYPLLGETIELTFTAPNATAILRTTTTNSTGGYEYPFKPDAAGLWGVEAHWDGDATHEPGTSAPASFTVNKMGTSLTCIVSPTIITLGKSVTVQGILTPPMDAMTIELTFTAPNSTEIVKTANTNTTGGYKYIFTPDAAGLWSIYAHWDGDASHNPATSSTEQFSVATISTLLGDGFEGWDDNWDLTASSWYLSSDQKHTGGWSVKSDAWRNGYFYSDPVDASSSVALYIDFWYRKSEPLNLWLQYWDGSNWYNIVDLNTLGGSGTWIHYTETVVDAQYLKSGFRVRLYSSLGGNQRVWLDDAVIKKVTSSLLSISDGFEAWNDKWDIDGMSYCDWYLASDQHHTGSWAVKSDSGKQGEFRSDPVDASGAAAVSVDFWFRKTNIDANDLWLYYYDGSNWDPIKDLDTVGGDDTWLHFTEVITDPQYLKTNFRVQLYSQSLGTNQMVWVDDAVIKRVTAGASAINDGFEAWNDKWDATASNWYLSSDQKHGGSWSVKSDSSRQGNFYSDPVDASGAAAIYVDLWYRKTDISAGQFRLYYWDGSNWDQIIDFDSYTPGPAGDYSWQHYTQIVTDSQYLKNGFRIILQSSLSGSQQVWVDDAAITKITSSMLNDDFEAWNDKWDTGYTNYWYLSSDRKHSGNWAVKSDSSRQGEFWSDPVDASGAAAVSVDFWFRKTNIDANDFRLYYWDGSNWDQIVDLDTLGADDTWLHYTHIVTDSQYLKTGFRIRLYSSSLSGSQQVWVDDAEITKITAAMLNDDFEAWNDKWDATASNWYLSSDQKHTGGWSVKADSIRQGDFYSDPVDASGAAAVSVDFWFRKTNIATGQFWLYYWDGGTWDQIVDLDTLGADYTWLHYVSAITDPQYLKNGFRIRFWCGVGSPNQVWVDDAVIKKVTSGVFSLNDGFETWNDKWDTVGTLWFLASDQKHSGGWSVKAIDGRDGDFRSDYMDTSGAAAIFVDFWYRKTDISTNQFRLWFYDGGTWDLIDDLDSYGGSGSDNIWVHYTRLVTDPQYLKTNFMIDLWCDMYSNQMAWVDDFTVTKIPSALLNDGFEGYPWNDKWDETPSNWLIRDDQKYAGLWSAGATVPNHGDFVSDPMDASGATAIGINFWFRKTDISTNTFWLYYWDGTTWDQIVDLDTIAYDNTWTNYIATIIDPQYLKDGFRIRFSADLTIPNQAVWVDNFVIAAKKSEAPFFSDGFEIEWASNGWHLYTDQKFSGEFSARSNYGYAGDFTSSPRDLSGATTVYVDFWYRLEQTEADDLVLLITKDGITWDAIASLGGGSSTYWSTWRHFTYAITDPQYFTSNFAIRFNASPDDGSEYVWIDDAKILIPTSETTLLSDTFETTWQSSTWRVPYNVQWYSPYYSAESGDGYEGNFDSLSVDASGATTIYVDFWFRKNDIETGDFVLFYWNGTTWNPILDLDMGGSYNDQWRHYSAAVTDPQYLINGFRIRLSSNLDPGEYVYIDDAKIFTSTSGASLLSDNFEINWQSSTWHVPYNDPSPPYSGTYAAKSTDGAEGNFDSGPVDASEATAVYVDFWFRKTDINLGDFLLFYWNGTSWIQRIDLDSYVGDNTWLHWSDTVTGSQYLINGFKIRLYSELDSGDSVWIDDAKIFTTTSGTSLLSDTFEINWQSSGWYTYNDQRKTGDFSARANQNFAGDLTSNPFDATGASAVYVDFYYRLSNTEADDLALYITKDGTTWVFVANLGGGAQSAWLRYSFAVTDSQYLTANFAVRLNSSPDDTNEYVWIDDVKILVGTAETTLLSDAFEINWDSSSWYVMGDFKHSGLWSAKCSDGYEGNLDSKALDASSAAAISIDFWFRKSDIDPTDFVLYYWNGTTWNSIVNLDTLGSDNTWLHYSQKIIDSQYFRSDFKIRFAASNLESWQNVWIDDVLVKTDTP